MANSAARGTCPEQITTVKDQLSFQSIPCGQEDGESQGHVAQIYLQVAVTKQ